MCYIIIRYLNQCFAKQSYLFFYLFSLIFYLETTILEKREERKEKSEENKKTTIFCRKLSFLFGGEGGIFRSSTHGLRCPKQPSGSRDSSAAFDRCTNGASLHLPPAALGPIARDYAARVKLGLRQAKRTSLRMSLCLAEKEGFEPSRRVTALLP